MKNLTKKLFLSMLTVAFAVVALGTTTFAWFTLATEAKIEAFTGQVTAGEGFEIAVTRKGDQPADGSWFSGNVPASVVNALIEDTFRFDAVTPSNNVDLKAFSKLVLENQEYVKKDATSGVLQLDIHFRLVDKNEGGKTYNLNFDSFSLTGAESDKDSIVTGWTCDKAFDITASSSAVLSDKYKYNVASAARFALCDPTTEVAKGIYQNKAGVAREGEIANTTGIVTASEVKDDHYVGALGYFNAKNNSNVVHPEPEEALEANSERAKNVLTTPGDGLMLSTISGKNIVKTTLKVWLEGWDNECMNAIFNQKLSLALVFKLIDPTEQQ